MLVSLPVDAGVSSLSASVPVSLSVDAVCMGSLCPSFDPSTIIIRIMAAHRRNAAKKVNGFLRSGPPLCRFAGDLRAYMFSVSEGSAGPELLTGAFP